MLSSIRTVALASTALLLAVAAPAFAEPPATPAASAPAQPAKLYDEAADAKAQIAQALARAKKENRRVLIQWGGNWCPWCIRLADLYKSDKTIAKALQYEYDVVHVDTGKPTGKNVDLAKSYGADVAKHGFPFLTILDADGKPLANQETEALEVKNAEGKSAGLKEGHDPAKVLAFLKDHAAPPLDAKKFFNAGLADARTSGKVVFLHFGAPWCIWCRRMEAWMDRPDVRPLLDKAFVDLKIDTDRMTGGQDLLNTSRGSQSGGIPWFAFIDPSAAKDAKPLITSDGPKGNIGFPSEPEEIQHFAAMLAKAEKLTPTEREALIATLGKK